MAGGKITPLIAAMGTATKQDVSDLIVGLFNALEIEINALNQRIDRLQDTVSEMAKKQNPQ